MYRSPQASGRGPDHARISARASSKAGKGGNMDQLNQVQELADELSKTKTKVLLFMRLINTERPQVLTEATYGQIKELKAQIIGLKCALEILNRQIDK